MFAHVTRSHICIIKQRRNLHKNRVQCPKEYFTPPTWPPFLCSLLQHGRHDVMGTHSITCVGDDEDDNMTLMMTIAMTSVIAIMKNDSLSTAITKTPVPVCSPKLSPVGRG